MKDSMKPVDVGAPVLIPQADLGEHPGSYGGLRRALDAVRAGSKIKTRSTANPGFVPGYYGDAMKTLKGEWQTTTIK